MSWFSLKKAKTIVYLPNNEYGKFVNQYAEKNQWSVSDKVSFYITGSKRNKEKTRIYNFIIDSMAKVLTIDKMHRPNQIVKRCTAFAHP